MIDKNLPALIPLLFLFAALIIPLIGVWKKNLSYPIALLTALASVILSLYGFVFVILNGSISYYFGGWIPPLGIEYVYDHLSSFVVLVINFIALIVIANSYHPVNLDLDGKQTAYYSVVMLLLTGFNGMIITGDLFNLYVFIEISSLAGYALIGVGDKKAPFAAFKYLIIGTIGASFYLLGIGYLYFMSGTLNMTDLSKILPLMNDSPTIIVALILIVVGFGIKMAIFPMHGWLPDSYTYAPSSSSSLIAPIGTKVGAYAMIRLLYFVFGVEYFSKDLVAADLIAVFSSAGIIFGSVLAIAQKEMKRMLAYSSVAQIGYIGLGIGLANPFGFIGAVLHLLNHAFMKATLFMVAGSIIMKEGHSDIFKFDDTYRKKYPWTMAAFTVAALSMVGLPPLAGFFSKWYLALGTIENSSWLFLAVILISSLLNAVYFFRILEKVYMKSPEASAAKEEIKRNEIQFSMLIPILVLAIGLIVLGILNFIIVEHIYKMMPEGML
ncbi:nadh:ubiquinone oxidoreductase subunit 5 (chain l)/multisubunit na+/h+ antiporter, mnha subunit [hydrocarbon metagenome]|uniref:Nadh:ubiquinone oxidoreductase subunit 5 (Chain l)/multisubunit na+/h+ antiporter, mnha subunit n=1 Tax=hydrocarbon metagenome TaxID=938273 RepID=A0A0W8FZJ3_9ZZZZ